MKEIASPRRRGLCPTGPAVQALKTQKLAGLLAPNLSALRVTEH